MFENFGLGISKIFKTAENIRYDLRHPYVGSEHLLLAILKEQSEISNILKKYNVTYTSFKKELTKIVSSTTIPYEANLYTPLLKRIIDNALSDANSENEGIVTTRHLLLSMLEEGEGIALRIMLIMDVDIEKLYKELKEDKEKYEKISIDYGISLNDDVKNDEKVVCRDNELERIIETLLRHKKNNPLLIGKAGVGKTAIVEELARRINRNEVPKELENSKIVMLEMGNLVSGTKYRGEFEEKLTKIIDKVTQNKNIILFIDEIHSMVNAGSADGAISASDILKPYLARGNIKLIGATTMGEYNKYFLKDKALNRRFERIIVDEPSIESTKEILKAIKKEYEQFHNIKITNKNIDDIVELSSKYIHDKCNPDKSIELLDSICANIKTKNRNSTINNEQLKEIIELKNKYVKSNDFTKALKYKTLENKIKKKVSNFETVEPNKITKNDILKVIEIKTNIPITNKKEIINEICMDLQNNIIGQDDAIRKIKNDLLMNKEGVKSLLFIGSSGIGKTMAAKIMAKNYNLVKLDMSEYSKETSVTKLIGADPGYAGYNDNYIFEIVKQKPYSLILVDEIEKASPKVLNLFLNILDEGKLTDSIGDEIDFNNCLIIATGNINTEKNLGFGNIRNSFDRYLSKELVGRFDDVIEFKTLNKEDVIRYINKKYNLSKDEVEKIVKESDYYKYGIRDIQNKIKKCMQYS